MNFFSITSNRKANQFPNSIVFIVLMSLILKMLLLQWNQGEYTDGIIQLQLWESPIVFFPPGYSALVTAANFLIEDLVLAGRVVSILASVASLIVFYLLALHVLDNVRQAEWATLFLALSPVFNRWSIRVMTDSFFCLGFILCTYMLMLILNGKSKRVCYLIGLVGLFSLVRYQAFFFTPFIAWVIYKKRELWAETTPWGAIKSTIISLTPWIVLGCWIAYRGFGHQEQFAERAMHDVLSTMIGYWVMFETFILYYPWAVTYSLFICGVAGIACFWQGNCAQKRFVQFFLIAVVAFLIVQSAFRSFQYRYLLPLIPLWCVMAGYGVVQIAGFWNNPIWRSTIKGVVIVNLALMTIAVLYYQRGAFGDLVDSAKYLRETGKESRVLSDERYGAHADNVKMEFWSGREILPIFEHEPRAGDLIVLHNTYSPNYAEIIDELRKEFDVVPIQSWSAATSPGSYMAIPLLPDIMVAPQNIPLTSNPECMAFRFTPQYYYSVIFRLKEKK